MQNRDMASSPSNSVEETLRAGRFESQKPGR